MISLLLLLISCHTRPAVKPTELDIPFPVFPDPTNQVAMMEQGSQYLPAGTDQILEAKTDLVVMPLDYWLLITEYKIEVDKAEELYKDVNRLF